MSRSNPSAFVHAVRLDDAIVVLDEINRVDPRVANPLLPLLDERRRTYVPELRMYVEVGAHTIFVATANLGEGFTGTAPMDRALGSRLSARLLLTPPSQSEMTDVIVAKTGCPKADATKLARIVKQVNALAQSGTFALAGLSEQLSLREALAAGEYIRAGLSIGLAVRLTMVNQFDGSGESESERYCVEQVVAGILGPEALQ